LLLLSDYLCLFEKTKSAEILKKILDEHGPRGFSLACRRARISRGSGKRMLKIYNDDGEISQIAKKA
ncbi:MAG TPA: hypothetical protein DCZ10_10685, partial [Pelotomaculum sp.]|nr:hypothetical protein [Pelotomaculum sp.]